MGLLLGNWKLIAGAALVVGAFLAGWNVNGTRWESKWNAALVGRAEAVQEERDRLQDEFELQRSVDDDARRRLGDDLLALRSTNERLEEELGDARLTKTPDQVVTEFRDRVIREEVEICSAPVLANPFTLDFARLFNDSASGGSGLSGADPQG